MVWKFDSQISDGTEMEFLDINLTKDSSLLLHAIHSPSNWRVLKKTILESIHEQPFVKKKNESRKPDKT